MKPRLGLAIGLLLLATACARNPVKEMAPSGLMDPRTNIILGLETDSTDGFFLHLVKYDSSTCQMEGGCFVWPRVDAEIMPGLRGAAYFGFQVPPGDYLFHNFTGQGEPRHTAFVAPKGKTVYLGDFVDAGRDRNGDATARLERTPQRLADVRRFLAGTTPMKAAVPFAAAYPVNTPVAQMVLCMP